MTGHCIKNTHIDKIDKKDGMLCNTDMYIDMYINMYYKEPSASISFLLNNNNIMSVELMSF